MGREWAVMCNGAREELPAIAATLSAEIVDEHAPSLNEIFVAHASATASTQHATAEPSAQT